MTIATKTTKGRFETMRDLLQERGFRLTPQRLAVLEILAGSGDHPSVEEIHDAVRTKFPTTSLATVYKTISLLKELGQVLELGFPDVGNRYDGIRPAPHPHVVCTRCRRIMDPELESFQDLTEEMARKTGYKILFHRMDFFGLCPVCQKQA